MNDHCSLSCDNSLCVVTKLGSLRGPELHVAVWHGGHPDICDACSLQADCDALFGALGVNCQIHRKGERWVKVTKEQQQRIADLLK